MNVLMQDLRYALRQLRRTAGFSMTVVLTLALSIGANTAIFSVVNALMLKRLPYSRPESMGTTFTRVTGSVSSDERHHLDGEQWELLRDDVPALISAVAGIRTSGVNLEASSRVQYVYAGRISAHYLDVLSIHPIIGRNFSDAEDVPHGPKTAILSYGLWRNAFGSTPKIVGQTIRLKGDPHTVIAVLPDGVTTPLNADIYTALQPSRQGEGVGTNFECITRLRDVGQR
jgi:MacB-like periplasmic core domain